MHCANGCSTEAVLPRWRVKGGNKQYAPLKFSIDVTASVLEIKEDYAIAKKYYLPNFPFILCASVPTPGEPGIFEKVVSAKCEFMRKKFKSKQNQTAHF